MSSCFSQFYCKGSGAQNALDLFLPQAHLSYSLIGILLGWHGWMREDPTGLKVCGSDLFNVHYWSYDTGCAPAQ